MQTINLTNKIDIKKITSSETKESSNHSHPYYELVYARKANFNYFIKSELYHISDQNIVLINKNTFHKAVFQNNNKYVYFTIKFHEKCIPPELSGVCSDLFNKKNIVINSNDFFMIDLLFSKLYHEYTSKNEMWESLIVFQLNELIVLLSRMDAGTKQSNSKLLLPEIKDIIDIVNSNITAPLSDLSLEKMSRKFSMSPPHLSRLFKKQVGVGFKEYVVSNKVLRAKNMIMSSELSITEIAYLCGFNDSNYFSTVFKKAEGISPSAYARYIKKNI